MKVLLAGFGNVLRQDDGFGVALLRELQAVALPPGVDLLEAGIGGIALVQDLLLGYDAVIVLDALEGDTPGVVKVLEANVPDLEDLPRDVLADTHYAEPGRALVLAKAAGVLPERVYIVGCVAGACELGEELTPAARAALEEARAAVLNLLETLAAAPAGKGG